MKKNKLTKEEHKRMGTGGSEWWYKIKCPTESTSPKTETSLS